MAIVTMADAQADTVASSAEYNKVTANVRDLDSRLTTGSTAIAALQTEAFGDPSRTAKPKCNVRQTSAGFVTLPYATDTMINWQTEDLDSDNMFTPGQSGITIPVSGVYLSIITINLTAISGVTSGSIAVKLLKNTTDPNPNSNPTLVLDTDTSPFNSAAEGPVIALASRLGMTTGDVLRVSAWHNFQVGSTQQNVSLSQGIGGIGTKWRVMFLGK